MEKLDSKVAAS